MEPSEIQFQRPSCFLFFQNLNKKCTSQFFWHRLILSTFPFLRPSLNFSETLSPLLACCPISVLHIWKAYDPYFSLVQANMMLCASKLKKIEFEAPNQILKFYDGKWHISEKCLKHCQIISKQASQWFIFQLNTMPSHYKLAKVRLTVQKRSLVSWKHSWWRKTAKKFEEKQAFFGVLPFFSVSS